MPPTTGNESQGLKIATILLSILSFILAITTYFGFANAATESERAAKAEKDKTDAQRLVDQVQRASTTLRNIAGYEKLDATDSEGIEKATKNDRLAIKNKVQAIAGEVNKTVGDVAAKGGDKALTDIQKLINDTSNGLRDENQSLKSMLDRMTELVKQNTQLTTAMALDNLAMRRNLELVNQVNQEKLKVAEDKRDKAEEDLRNNVTKSEDARKSELAKYEEDRGALRTANTKTSELEGIVGQVKDQLKRDTDTFKKQISDFKTRLDKQETVLDVADGHVTYVDYKRNEVRLNLTKADGIHPQMRFAIFDRGAQGLPTDRPKAMVKIIQVGEKDSLASIETPGNEFEKSYQTSHPIYAGDQAYSSVWNPNEPKRIALVGPIDINRAGIDDRRDLKRLIEQAGGTVVYDLPPPRKGVKYGNPNDLTIAFYVIDERKPIFSDRVKEDTSDEYRQYEDDKKEVINTFRQQGIPPMPVERLLPMLGYSYGMKKPGQTEAVNRNAAERLLNPFGKKAATSNGSESDNANNNDQP
jgi:hypothetical protein